MCLIILVNLRRFSSVSPFLDVVRLLSSDLGYYRFALGLETYTHDLIHAIISLLWLGNGVFYYQEVDLRNWIADFPGEDVCGCTPSWRHRAVIRSRAWSLKRYGDVRSVFSHKEVCGRTLEMPRLDHQLASTWRGRPPNNVPVSWPPPWCFPPLPSSRVANRSPPSPPQPPLLLNFNRRSSLNNNSAMTERIPDTLSEIFPTGPEDSGRISTFDQTKQVC